MVSGQVATDYSPHPPPQPHQRDTNRDLNGEKNKRISGFICLKPNLQVSKLWGHYRLTCSTDSWQSMKVKIHTHTDSSDSSTSQCGRCNHAPEMQILRSKGAKKTSAQMLFPLSLLPRETEPTCSGGRTGSQHSQEILTRADRRNN